MKLTNLLSIVPAILFGGFCFSQPICAFDKVHQDRLKNDAAYQKIIRDNEARIQNYISTHRLELQSPSGTSAVLFTIPVVVHVINTGGAIGTTYNPTDAQITGAINYLNQVYNGTYPGTQGAGDLQIQFALATKDPNCNATTGIDRYDASGIAAYVSNGVNNAGSSGISDLALKNTTRWDPVHYYNIWVVNKIDGKDGTSGQFVAGYAYFAGAPASVDGTVMLATQMITGQKTLPHEIGHALNLYHTFEGSTDVTICPANADCTADGDKVCDTDPISDNVSGGIYNFTCRSGTNTCTGTAYSINTESNYMSYTTCYTLFTAGQKARLLAAMSLPSRASLVSSWALPGGSYPATPFSSPLVASCTPVSSATGTGSYFAGLMNVAVGTKSFFSGATKDDAGYLDKTSQCLYLIPLQKSSTYSFTFTLLGANNEQVRAWIDYNNDGVFSNATEQIYYNGNIPAPSSGYATVSGTFTVPATATTATMLRMRVTEELATIYGTTVNGGCYNPTYGQAEDYPVFISASLPVKLEYFNGVRKDKDVLLTWKTSFEQNAEEFQVEKSTDGAVFTKIGTVAANNISNGAAYSYTDKNAGSGLVYYRLNQIDIDKRSEYSNVVQLKAGASTNSPIRVMSNPFAGHLELQFNHPVVSRAGISLFDMAGKKVYGNTHDVLDGQTISIDMTGKKLAPGIYLLRVQLGNEVFTDKVISQ